MKDLGVCSFSVTKNQHRGESKMRIGDMKRESMLSEDRDVRESDSEVKRVRYDDRLRLEDGR